MHICVNMDKPIRKAWVPRNIHNYVNMDRPIHKEWELKADKTSCTTNWNKVINVVSEMNTYGKNLCKALRIDLIWGYS